MPQYGLATQHNTSGEASLINGLNAAVNQQATLKRQTDAATAAAAQQGLKDRMEAYAAGAVDVPQSAQPPAATAPGRPTLKMPREGPPDMGDAAGTGTAPTATPYTMDPLRTLDFGGKPMNFPTDQQKGKTFVPTGGLGEALKNGGAWDGKTPMTQEQSHTLMMAINEAQPKDEPSHIDTSGKFLDAQGKPAAVIIGDKTGKARMLDLSGGQPPPGAAPGGPFDTSDDPGQPGQQSAPQTASGAAPGGAFTFAPPEKADKAEKEITPRIERSENDKGDVTTIAYHPQTGAKLWTQTEKGIGHARSDNDAAAQGIEQRAQQRARNADQKSIEGFQKLEQKQQALRGQYGSFLTSLDKTANGKSVALPDANSNPILSDNMRESLRSKYQAKYDAATELANAYADQQKQIVLRNTAAPATQTSPQQPAQRTAAQGAQATQTAPPGVTEGTVIVNKQTKQRQIWKGGKWAPAPSAP